MQLSPFILAHIFIILSFAAKADVEFLELPLHSFRKQKKNKNEIVLMKEGFDNPSIQAEVTMNHLRNNPKTAKKLSDCTKCLDEKKILELQQ
mmetsp:Transcript_10844/g.14920  ORF Transcript_10844/g.14920 Transcript_10844/m.14920 type:complete len:92 (-) Transcript_10844:151-426(-)